MAWTVLRKSSVSALLSLRLPIAMAQSLASYSSVRVDRLAALLVK
jgi:hypothetical protein